MPEQERKLIESVRRLAQTGHNRSVIKGIGDDTAVLQLKPRHEFLVTTDLCVEGFHFRREWHPAVCVGHRCLARGLSDIAAMGGEPTACFLSLGLPEDLDQKWVSQFVKGLTSLARRFGVELAGGDTSGAPAITADIVVTGQVPKAKAVLRSGAKPGDRIFVTGELGESAATLQRFFASEKVQPSKKSRHFYPEPRVAVGQWLRRRGLATGIIDLSDGLSVDLSHICDESRVGAVIQADRVPIARQASLELALHGGEDYELLFTAKAGSNVPKMIEGVRVTEIGTIHRRSDYRLQMQILGHNGALRPLKPLGWEHFSGGNFRGTFKR
jgi:thiamine-monophosphate kinase